MGRSNFVQLTGNLGAAPEKKSTDKANFVVFSIYTQSNYFDEESQSWKRSQSKEIHDVMVFDNSKAYQLAQRLNKGDLVELKGKISYNSSPFNVLDSATNTPKTINIRQASIIANEIDLVFAAKDKVSEHDPETGEVS